MSTRRNPLLVAIEPNDEGLRIARIAMRIADQEERPLHVISVVSDAAEVYAGLDFAPLLECASDWQQASLNEYSDFICDIDSRFRNGNVNVSIGHPPTSIAAYASDLDTETIIMGLHTRRGLQRLLGSTTHAVLNLWNGVVLAIHPGDSLSEYRRVLIAVDHTDRASGVLERAFGFAKDAEAFQVVSAVVPLNNAFGAPELSRGLDWNFTDLSKDLQQESKRRMTESLKKFGCSQQDIFVPVGDPRDEIIKAAKEFDADLIVMGSNVRSTLNRWLLGSTARMILNQSPCDVLITRA